MVLVKAGGVYISLYPQEYQRRLHYAMQHAARGEKIGRGKVEPIEFLWFAVQHDGVELDPSALKPSLKYIDVDAMRKAKSLNPIERKTVRGVKKEQYEALRSSA